ncbi:hypothetical protein ACWEPD_11675 [Streptomyces pseudogriseolus]
MATVYQKCKTDRRSPHHPCARTRCGHPWSVRYRAPDDREKQRTFEQKTQAEAFRDRLTRDRYEGLYLDPKRGEITVREYATDWLAR